MGGPIDFNFITPSEYLKKYPDMKKYHTLKQLQDMAKSTSLCEVCGQPAWKLAGTNLCFPCTTGEHDASYDYELTPE